MGVISLSQRKRPKVVLQSPSSSEKLPWAESLAGPQDLAASHLASSKGTLVHIQQLPPSKTSEDHAELKFAQLFWGSPSLHSEVLHPTTASCDHSSTFGCFNSMAEACIANNSPIVTLPIPLSMTKSQPQTWLQTLPQSHSQRDPLAKS